MKLVIRAEELNFTIYKYLIENGYEHTAFCFRQEAGLPAALVLHSEIPPPKDAQIGASSSRHKLKNYFPAHCLITLIHKAMLYLWIEYHTDLATKKLTSCDMPFSLFKSHTCKAPSRTSTSVAATTHATTTTSTRTKRKTPANDTPTSDDVGRLLTTHSPNDIDTHITVEPSPSPSLHEKRSNQHHSMSRSSFDFLDTSGNNNHNGQTRFKSHNNTTMAAKIRANDILIGRKRDSGKKTYHTHYWSCLANYIINLVAEWHVVGLIEQPPNLKPSVMDFSPNLNFIVIWWENTTTNSGDVCLYEIHDNRITAISLGDDALQLINVRSIRWSTDRPLFRVNGTGRRDTYAVTFQKTDGQWLDRYTGEINAKNSPHGSYWPSMIMYSSVYSEEIHIYLGPGWDVY